MHLLEKDPIQELHVKPYYNRLIQFAGEITTNANIDYHEIARETVRRIGYDHSDKGFDANTCGVNLSTR
jgi:S-adenosylmethionine synthetase